MPPHSAPCPTCLRGLTNANIIQVWRKKRPPGSAQSSMAAAPRACLGFSKPGAEPPATPCGESEKYLRPVRAGGHRHLEPALGVPTPDRLSHPQLGGPQPGHRLLIQTLRACRAALGPLRLGGDCSGLDPALGSNSTSYRSQATPLPEGGRRLAVLPVSVLPSLQGTQLPNWKLSFPASLANSFRQVTISICGQERYKLLLPLLLPRTLLIQGFLSSSLPTS